MSKFLEKFVELAKKDEKNHVYRVSEIVNGSEPETANLRPANDCCNCYSIAKTFTCMAIGILVDEGLLSVEEKIVDLFPEYIHDGIDPRWHSVTVDMVLSHHCGFGPGDMDIDRFDIYENFGDDFLFYIFNNSLVTDPGAAFTYSDSAYYLLSRVVSVKCGEKLDDFLWKKLLLPLKFQELAWSRCPQGYPMGATGLYIKSCDLAKFGEMILKGGVYKDQRLVSEEWIETAKKRNYDLYPTGYGNSFYKGGMYGQQLIMNPDTQRVVAWHAMDCTEELYRFACEYKD